ncbi:MAG: glycosyltransferase family 4 protein, partial [Candidatus Helarchaeota archaeon]
MRICLFSTSFFPKIGGAEFVIHNLAKYLTKLGHEVTVLVPKYRKVKEEIECSYNIRRYKLLPRLLFIESTLIAHLLLEKVLSQFDILHCNFSYLTGYCATKLKKILKIPIVVTLHGADI